MNRKTIARTTAVLSVLGAIGSAAAMLLILSHSLDLPELSFSLLSAALGVLTGVFSVPLARFAMKFRRSRRVFISYSHTDHAIAHEVAEALRSNGTLVWLDQERIKLGESIPDAIERGIDNSDAVVVLLSDQPTPNLLLELGMAKAKGLRIVPVRVSDGEIPADLQGLRYIDLRDKRGSGIQELVNATV